MSSHALARDAALAATPQPAEGATYAARSSAPTRAIDWRAAAVVLWRRSRAFDPCRAPGALVRHRGEVAAARPVSGRADAPPGTVLAVSDAGIDVACAPGEALRIASSQAGRRRAG
jgi:methionyl-tRNA formyltransferase